MRPPRYLFVCTANINRSPSAAAWAGRLLSNRLVAAEVRSAGTHAWDGAEAGADTVEAMRELGFDLRPHRSALVTQELLDWADHVVVMEPLHEEVLKQRLPEGKLVRLWAWIEGADHVEDPHGLPLPAHRESVARIGEAVEKMVDEHLAALRAARSRRSTEVEG